MKLPILHTFLLLFLSSISLSANPTAQFDAANAAYQNGQYESAITQYETLLNEGTVAAEIYYNLGNAYFKTKKLGAAILNYERGLLISPNDADLQFNLAIAQAKTQDDLDQIGAFFLEEWWRGLHQLFDSTTWSILTILSIWSGAAGMILWLFGTTRDLKKKGFIGGILLLLLGFLLYFVTRSQAQFEAHSGSAIVLAEKIALKNAPDAASTDILDIHEGLKVTLLDEIGDWYKVKLSNGDQGWLPMSSIEEI
ncbi:MAG: tetratricopeptide repeat protein [Bacteroidota bacterium]